MGNQRRVLLSTALMICAAAVLPAQEILNTLRVSVDVVLVNVSVTDSRNETVTGLAQEDFELFEDKVQQEIRYFSNEDAPVSLGVIFDASGSMDEKAAFARDAAITFLKTSTREDEFFLVQFSDYAWLTQDFTTNVSRVEKPSGFAPHARLDSLVRCVVPRLKQSQGRAALQKSPTAYHRRRRQPQPLFARRHPAIPPRSGRPGVLH